MGLVVDLKDRLARYLKSESIEDDFEILEDNPIFLPEPINKTPINDTEMADNKKTFFKPGKFEDNTYI